ncbi:glucose-1-phosphate thymidylyltransferase RfbA [Heliobacterium gestii]|uniref:Glucose-1-phosphate thymidylyltransferase n=1 Tax=Heliomicrobium gestii TaxID=2699 RepID=A0A845LI20_HELGE|nr:glucose-1-phosphate thymidylyltransferase RfbA [Heliomicrobium gestii]MBM7866617.1 glucose-1-phosphate thymidylyltransferase [Heliomicrobium gestii]MZP43103.1 glucose-1-phosphate thymidylyltransferase RfbA [Heliomicrobium gestii]
MIRKGIILAGGSGTRLYPLTHVISKQLMPVYDKPMIYYPLTTLMLSGITDILVITTPRDSEAFQTQLGDGSQWGINISYEVQERPDGLPQAFIIGRHFIGNDGCALILGDNIFYGHRLNDYLLRASNQSEGATVFGYWVKNPEDYGVVEFDVDGKVCSIEEKPLEPKSNYAVTGLYYYDHNVADIARELTPSSRGELEITDLNKVYLQRDQLRVEKLRRGIAWLDTGTYETLLQAANYVATIEQRQGLKVCCPEEVAFNLGLIDAEQLERLAETMKKNSYGRYLMNLPKFGRQGD